MQKSAQATSTFWIRPLGVALQSGKGVSHGPRGQFPAHTPPAYTLAVTASILGCFSMRLTLIYNKKKKMGFLLEQGNDDKAREIYGLKKKKIQLAQENSSPIISSTWHREQRL